MYNNLNPELRKKLENWENNTVPAKQLQTLRDIASMSQELIEILDNNKTTSTQDVKEFGAVLQSIRGTLEAIRDKESPDAPDYASPVVRALTKAEKSLQDAIRSIDIKPVIKVDAPQVSVAPADVEIDLSAVEKILRTELPKALQDSFDKTIAKIPRVEIPETDLTPLAERLDSMSEQLESIDVGTRLKVQFPSSFEVSNIASTPVETTYATKITVSGTDTYVGEAAPGSAQASATWRIQKIDNDGNVTWKNGSAAFGNTATDLTTGDFS